MNRFKSASLMAILGLCLVVVFLVAGCGGKSKGAPTNVNCIDNIKWEVAPEAMLTKFDCTVGKHGGQPALIFTVEVVNATDKPQRFRVNIFLEDMDKGAGHMVPRKGKPPVLGPGNPGTVKIPFIGVDQKSKDILVMVKTATY